MNMKFKIRSYIVWRGRREEGEFLRVLFLVFLRRVSFPYGQDMALLFFTKIAFISI